MLGSRGEERGGAETKCPWSDQRSQRVSIEYIHNHSMELTIKCAFEKWIFVSLKLIVKDITYSNTHIFKIIEIKITM